jgi:hypothetical protein
MGRLRPVELHDQNIVLRPFEQQRFVVRLAHG